MKMSLRRKLFYGATLAVVAALLLLPSTGWLARRQLLPLTLPDTARSLFLVSDKAKRDVWEADYQKAIRQNSDAFNPRLAYAFASADNAEVLRRLEKLDAAFPNNPVVLAALLKRQMTGVVKLNRVEQDLLTDAERKERDSKNFYLHPTVENDPVAVARFVALAEQGEQLEPRNAFFPVMAAWGRFAARQDDAARAAWLRAAQKPLWDSHDTEPVAARWELSTAMNNGVEAGYVSRI
ncbi:MAG: hypothetical protein H7Y38_12845, partial [Armatimonadetes bacterium]|nr:hypothetical protein [Armatimonadota bacterium]